MSSRRSYTAPSTSPRRAAARRVVPRHAGRGRELRDDVAPRELASYCLHALTAAGDLPSEAAVHRLVTVTLTGVRPSAAAGPSGGPRQPAGAAQPPHHHGHRPAHGPHTPRS
jgi:hypothetical protein